MNPEPAPLTPTRDAQERRIEEYRRKIAKRREEIIELTLLEERLRQEIERFQHEYNAQVGRLYVELDRVELEIKELLLRARLVERGWAKDPATIERRVERAFRTERRRLDEFRRATQVDEEPSEPSPKERKRPSKSSEPDRERPSRKLRRLYLRLAKRFHPDKAPDPETRARHEEIMALINRAYRDRDAERLRQLEMTVSAEEIEEEDTNALERRLFREYLRLDRTTREIRAEIDRIKANEVYRMKEEAEAAKARGEDLLGELRRELMRKIDAAKGRLALIRNRFGELMNRFGLFRSG